MSLHSTHMGDDILKEHSEILLKLVIENIDDIVVVFDADLNYLIVNDAACNLLQMQKHKLIGKNLLELFPNLTASNSHRQLLHALSGKTTMDARSEGTFTREGAKYTTSYHPLKNKGMVFAILAITKKIYFPNL